MFVPKMPLHFTIWMNITPFYANFNTVLSSILSSLLGRYRMTGWLSCFDPFFRDIQFILLRTLTMISSASSSLMVIVYVYILGRTSSLTSFFQSVYSSPTDNRGELSLRCIFPLYPLPICSLIIFNGYPSKKSEYGCRFLRRGCTYKEFLLYTDQTELLISKYTLEILECLTFKQVINCCYGHTQMSCYLLCQSLQGYSSYGLVLRRAVDYYDGNYIWKFSTLLFGFYSS